MLVPVGESGNGDIINESPEDWSATCAEIGDTKETTYAPPPQPAPSVSSALVPVPVPVLVPVLPHSDSPNSVRDAIEKPIPSRPLIRAPFEQTLRYDARGENVAILRSSAGHVYWGTMHEPPPHMDVIEVDPRTAPADVLEAVMELGASITQCSMWILRHGALRNHVGADSMPSDTLLRCRAGFVPHDLPKPFFTGHAALKLARRVLRLHKVLATFGGHNLGVRRIGNKFKFSLRKLTSFLTCTSDQLAALIADSPTTAACFSGNVSYAAIHANHHHSDDEPDGLIYLAQPVPAGKWLAGRFIDSGRGLVATNEAIYYKVENFNNVSKLVRVYPHQFHLNSSNTNPVVFADFIQ